MIGITSYGAYIPRLRLSRSSIVQGMGWFAPAIMVVSQGERSMCNWDEDSITMAVAAARDCLVGADKAKLDALYLASTTLPFADRQNAGIVSAAMNLPDEIITADFTAAQKVATTALITALESIQGGNRKNILVAASDKRETKAAYFYEMWFGDGAAALTVGDEDVIAEYLGSYSFSCDFVDHYRGSFNQYDYVWEERWTRDFGYGEIIPKAVTGLFDKLGISMDDVDKLVYPCFFKGGPREDRQATGRAPEKAGRQPARGLRRNRCRARLHDVHRRPGTGATRRAHPAGGVRAGRQCPLLQGDRQDQKDGGPQWCGRIPGQQEDHRQLSEMAQVPGPDQDRNGHPGRSAHPDGHHRVVAQEQNDPGPGGRQMPGMRHPPVSQDGFLRQPGLRRPAQPGRLRIRRCAGQGQDLHRRPAGRIGRSAGHLRHGPV